MDANSSPVNSISMAEVVFVLGAGASKSGGVPLMGEFLNTADNLKKKGVLQNQDEEAIEKVFEGIAALQDIHSKADLDLSNIESVFAAFEMSKTLGGFAGYSSDDVDDFIGSLRRLIVVTIEYSLEFNRYSNSSSPILASSKTKRIEVKPPNPYGEFVEEISNIRNIYDPNRSVSVITFNYDLAIDYSFHFEGINIDYGLDNQNVGEKPIPLLKLHGSLNWARGKDTGEIYPWVMEDFLGGNWIEYSSSHPYKMNIGSKISEYQDTEEDIEEEPTIVPPTWNKSGYYDQLQSVWSKASDELGEAEHIFCIGFSLNPTDSFFQYLYGLGTVGGRPLKSFYVIDPAIEQIRNRYNDMLGPAAGRVFTPKSGTFEDALEVIEGQLS